jgi:hypothetical protein
MEPEKTKKQENVKVFQETHAQYVYATSHPVMLQPNVNINFTKDV